MTMNDNQSIQPGLYKHYKGNEYTVLGTARHSESQEEMVVYRQEYDEHSLWVRPKRMFAELVTVAGRSIPRFQPMQPRCEPAGSNSENIFANLPDQLPKELVQILLRAEHVCIERIISHGHSSPTDFWYDQAQHEWVIVLQGAARLQFEQRLIEMKPGDFINIPAFTRHRVDWTVPDQPTVWLGVRYGGPV